MGGAERKSSVIVSSAIETRFMTACRHIYEDLRREKNSDNVCQLM
jgi:methanogenic corrinoid protein MtbC1